MKRFLLAFVSAMIPLLMSAQAQITTKNEKIEDFPEKTTKIVLTGNEFFDSSMKEEISTRWSISPFEFCTISDFDSLKADDSYYFLIPLKSRFKRETEPGIEMLSLIKGGEGADKGIRKMLELVSVPMRSARYPSGRELIFLPALIDIIQEQVIYALDRGINAYTTLESAYASLSIPDDMTVVFAEEDLSDEITSELMEEYFKAGIIVTGEDKADDMMLRNSPDTLVSYTVCPFEPVTGSYCYKMLIDAGTHELHYFRKHRINRHTGPGFLAEDMMRIAESRNNRQGSGR